MRIRLLLPLSFALPFACDDASPTRSMGSTGETDAKVETGSESTTSDASDGMSSSGTSTAEGETLGSTGVTTGDTTGDTGGDTTGETTGDTTGGPMGCGDGVLADDETCDGDLFRDVSCASMGFAQGTLLCTNNCTTVSTDNCSTCGNGIVEGAEGCDGEEQHSCEWLGYASGVPTCNLETCELDESQCYTCGDGEIGGPEVCEPDDIRGTTCVDLGLEGGEVACGPDCVTFSTDSCFGCGNERLEEGEVCDGSVDPSVTCVGLGLGFTAGTVSCDQSVCDYDTTQCSTCGDGMITGTEQCEGEDLGGVTCESIGFEAGALGCNENCGFSYTGCSGGMYIQDFESGALPSEWTVGGDAPWTVVPTTDIEGVFSAASGDIDDSQTSLLTLSVVFANDGTVEFLHREDTESSFDFLEFLIDDAVQESWSGVNPTAVSASFPVTAGAHELQWRYRKDISISTDADRVWIDLVRLTGGTPSN